MSADPKITETVLYGDRLCREGRECMSFIWDDDWLALADQRRYFQGPEIGPVAVQFLRRPARKRYVIEPELILGRILEDA